MKPIRINLGEKKNFLRNMYLGSVVALVIATLGITVANAVDYYATKNVVKTYELRLRELKKKSQRRKALQIKAGDNKEILKIKQDFNYLNRIITKNMVPLPKVLTEIERVKPDKININGLNFSDDFKSVKINGASNDVKAVSRFIIDMERSKYFDIELSRQEIKEDRKIIFELTAQWISFRK